MASAQVYADGAWELARLGKFTSSGITPLFSEPRSKADKDAGKLSSGAKTYLNEKVSELLTGTIRQMSVYATEWGDQYEPEAVDALREKYPQIEHFGNNNRKFFPYSKHSGGSPDAIVLMETAPLVEPFKRSATVFEIKCPENPANHIEFLTNGTELDLCFDSPAYWNQLQMNMLAVSVSLNVPIENIRGVFASYSPLMIKKSLRLKTIPVFPSTEFKKNLDLVLNRAEAEMEKIIRKLIL